MRLIFLLFLSFTVKSSQAQWIKTKEELYNPAASAFTFRFGVANDSIIGVSPRVYDRPANNQFPLHAKINRDGILLDSIPLIGNGIAQYPTSIAWTNDGHYLVGRDTTTTFGSLGSFHSRVYELRNIQDHSTMWSTSSTFQIPTRWGNEIYINSDGAFWVSVPESQDLQALSSIDGSILQSIKTNELSDRWQLSKGHNLIGSFFYAPIWRKSDTCIMRAEFVLDTNNNNIYKTFFALVSLDSLKLLSQPRVWADWSQGGYDRFNLDKFTHVKDSVIFKSGSKLDRVLYEEDMVTGSIIKTLRIKDLEFDPDTNRFKPNHFYEVYNRGAFCLYVEQFESKYPIGNSILSNSSAIVLRVRLYLDSTLIYEKEISDTSWGGYPDTELIHTYLFPNGDAILNLRVYDITSRLLYINAQGNHWLKGEKVYFREPVSVYPTLVEDQIFISCPAKKLKVQLYSLGGSLVHEQSLESFNETFQIGSLKLEPGIYILKGRHQNGAFTRKVIVR